MEIKCQLDATDDFYCRSYCLLNMFRAPLCPSSGAWKYYTSGHITISSTPYRQLENQVPNTKGSNHLYNTFELLMMGMMVPETCWASNKICIKNHLLHLVGILFPHINDDARSKPHQNNYCLFIWGSSRHLSFSVLGWILILCEGKRLGKVSPLHGMKG